MPTFTAPLPSSSSTPRPRYLQGWRYPHLLPPLLCPLPRRPLPQHHRHHRQSPLYRCRDLLAGQIFQSQAHHQRPWAWALAQGHPPWSPRSHPQPQRLAFIPLHLPPHHLLLWTDLKVKLGGNSCLLNLYGEKTICLIYLSLQFIRKAGYWRWCRT